MDIQRNPDSRVPRHPLWAVLSGLAALLLVAVLFLTLVRFQARALSTEGRYTGNLTAETAVITSQIRSPNRDAYITQRTPLTIEGIAWMEGSDPPYLTDDVFVSLQRLDEETYYVNWTPVASAKDYRLQEATSPEFKPEDITLSTWIAGTSWPRDKLGAEGTYYYRVRAATPDIDNPSRWSNVVSVTVPWLDATAGTLGATASEGALAASSSITVQVRIDDGDWHNAVVSETPWGAEWSYEWSLPEEHDTQHTIHSRAAGEEGDFGPVDTITVTIDNERYMVYLPLVFRRWPPVPYAPTLAEIVNPQHRVSYTLNWSYDGRPEVPDPTRYTLQEATDPAFTAPTIYTTTATQRDIKDPATERVGGTYYYRVRGHNIHGAGPWSTVRSTTVRVVPYAPTLHDIANPEGDDSYTVSWAYEYDYPAVSTFVLQEATNPGFSGAATDSFDRNTTSYDFTDKGNETYYYRVKGRNAYGDGPWSAIKSVASVSADFYDDFTDPTSGWAVHQATPFLPGGVCDDEYGGRENLGHKYSLYYHAGRYHTYIPTSCYEGGTHGFTRFIYPVSLAPGVQRSTAETCIEVRGSFIKTQHVASWGLVLASSHDMSTHYALWVNERGERGVIKRRGYQFPGPNSGQFNEHREHIIGSWDSPLWGARTGTTPNTLRVRIKGNNVTTYLNGVEMESFSRPDISSLTYVGIVGGSWEEGDVRIGYDYFYVDEGCDSF